MRLIARFAQEKEKFFEVITVYDERTIKEQLKKDAPTLTSIAEEYPAAVWFERKIKDDFGIEILYTTDERSLVKHEHFPKDIFPLRKEFTQDIIVHNELATAEDDSSENESLMIGPTQPYHLESAQFQFFEKNNTILHFEMTPFYKHRGIEKMVEGLTLNEAKEIVERISASQTIAYQTAFLDIELQATKKTLPDVIKKQHLLLLELERVINHLTDLSLLCQLVKFSDGAKFFSKHVEGGRKAMKKLTGHRFGFSSAGVDSNFLNREEVYAFLLLLEKELGKFEKWIIKKDKILEPMLSVGQISKEMAIKYGLVGIMARSLCLELDRRDKNDFFAKHDYYINMEEDGDAFSRFNIRISEIFTSLRMMRNLGKDNMFPFFLGTAMDGEYYSYVESTAGEVMMYVSLKEGLIERFFLRDPSFLNAQVLPFCIKNSEASSLSLIIKSIPLNISAIDL